MNMWLAGQIAELKGLQGKLLKKVVIRDMAFIEREDGIHFFRHPDCPFIQAQQIYIYLDNCEVQKIQATDEGCIFLSKVDNDEHEQLEESGSIFRLYECKEFPIGKLDSVALKQNSELDISEVLIEIDSTPILLKSGEVYEENDGNVRVCSDDESVLVFLDPEDAKGINFNA